MALLQLRMICFLSLFYEQFPPFSPSVCQLSGSLPCMASPSFQLNSLSLSLEEAVTAKSWIYAPMGDVCSSPRLQRLRTHRLVSFMCTYTLDTCMLYTYKGMNTYFWGISLKCQDFIASSTKPATKNPSFFQSRLILCIWLNFSHL